jgi:hypothetical protein
VFRYNVEETNRKRLNLGNGVIFQGFDSLYKQVLDIEDCPEVQVEAEETFDDLKKSFESFLEQDPSGRPQSQTQKTSKLTPNDDSRHVQLINLEP